MSQRAKKRSFALNDSSKFCCHVVYDKMYGVMLKRKAFAYTPNFLGSGLYLALRKISLNRFYGNLIAMYNYPIKTIFSFADTSGIVGSFDQA